MQPLLAGSVQQQGRQVAPEGCGKLVSLILDSPAVYVILALSSGPRLTLSFLDMARGMVPCQLAGGGVPGPSCDAIRGRLRMMPLAGWCSGMLATPDNRRLS